MIQARKKIMQGLVVSDKMDKTIVVQEVRGFHKEVQGSR